MRSIYNEPGIYSILVAGDLDAAWSDRLGGLAIVQSGTTAVEGAGPVVELRGWLPDQAALYGVLDTLYNNRYWLLHVEYLGPAHHGDPGHHTGSES